MSRPRLVSCLLPLLVALLLAGCAGRFAGPTPSPAAFQQVVETLADEKMQGRDAGTDGIDLARDYLVNQFKCAGLEPAFVVDGRPSYTQPFLLAIGVDAEGVPVQAEIANVGALLPGAGDLADQVVVVGGHYDHVGFGDVGSRDPEHRGELHPGADDNASGTAGVVLAARQLADQYKDATTPRRTILFTCFAGEERGLHGSRYMVNHPDQWPFDFAQTVAMINLDMIGRLRGGELYVFGDGSGQEWRGLVNELNQSIGLDLKWDVRPPGGSDHTNFISAGVPAVFFNTWLHEDYHTPNDTPDKINAEGGVRVVALVTGLLERLATQPQRVTYVAPEPRRPRPFVGAMLGQSDDGVRIDNLIDDGPMAKAGVRVGDLLRSIGGEAVDSPGDVRAFLAGADPGDEVTVVLLRDGQTVELTVRLDLRR